MKEKMFYALALMAAVCAVFTMTLDAQEKSGNEIKINWMSGPATADMDGIAKIVIPEKYWFANGDDTRKIMEHYGNPPSHTEVGYLEHENENWFIVFEFNDTGYIKDDEKNSLDADAILKSIRQGTEESNKWREKKGIPALTILGWKKKPSYNPETNNLEWAIINESSGSKNVNYNIRFLGRKGVMSVIIVADEEGLNTAVAAANKLLKTYTFTKGNKYSEFTKGDKIAEYGLAALITGGAGAAAIKSGLLQKFWKFIVAGLVAVGAGIKRFFTGNKNSSVAVKQEEDNSENS